MDADAIGEERSSDPTAEEKAGESPSGGEKRDAQAKVGTVSGSPSSKHILMYLATNYL